MQSLRRSIRESFRQRRRSTGAGDRRKIAESLNLEADNLAHKRKPARTVRPRASSEPTSPVLGASRASGGNESQVKLEPNGSLLS